ncbi:hypothetical protein ES703_37545 [subsurface metagenome]
MFAENIFHFNTGNIFTAAYDNVFESVFYLHITIGVHHSSIAGMEPSTLEGFACFLWLLEILLHQDITTKNNFSYSCPIKRHILHILIDHSQFTHGYIDYTLAHLDLSSLFNGKGIPFRLPFTHGDAIKRFSKTIAMYYLCTLTFQGLNHLHRRGGTTTFNLYAPGEL